MVSKTRRNFAGVVAALAVLVWLGAAAPAHSSMSLVGGWDGGDAIKPFLPVAVTVDSEGDAYVADRGPARVVQIHDDEAETVDDWPAGEAGATSLNPVDLAVDPDSNNVYALDMGSRKVRKFSNTGTPLGEWPVVVDNSYTGRWSIAWEGGKVWVLTGSTLHAFDPEGDKIELGEGAFEFDAIPAFVTPIVRGDGDGHLVIASARWEEAVDGQFQASRLIYRFDATNGEMETEWVAEAEVSVTSNPGGGGLTTVSGYRALAVDPAGGIWVAALGTENAFHQAGEDGLDPEGVGNGTGGTTLAIDDQNRFWTVRPGPGTFGPERIERIDPEGDTDKVWTETDLPNFADRYAPGAFRRVDAFAVDSVGQVAIVDVESRRIKVFTATGDFLRKVNLPESITWGIRPLNVDLLDDGTIELQAGSQVLRFDSSGSLVAEAEQELSGPLYASTRTASGERLVVSGSPGTVTTFDPSGQPTSSWPLVRELPEPGEPVGVLEGPDGRIYISTPYRLDVYSSSGVHEGWWSQLNADCTQGGSGIYTLATDAAGTIYVIANLAPLNWTKLYALSPSLELLWSENLQPAWGVELKVAPDGTFLTAGDGIRRLEQTGPKVPNLVTDCRQPPKPDPPRIRIVRVKYGPARAWARVRVHVSAAGTLRVAGPKIAATAKKVRARGSYWLVVRPKARFRKQVRSSRKLRTLKVRITYRKSGKVKTRTVRVRLRVRPLRR